MISVNDLVDITVSVKKSINVPRCKIGLSVGQLKSELNQ